MNFIIGDRYLKVADHVLEMVDVQFLVLSFTLKIDRSVFKKRRSVFQKGRSVF